jgi:hypothetical protein
VTICPRTRVQNCICVFYFEIHFLLFLYLIGVRSVLFQIIVSNMAVRSYINHGKANLFNTGNNIVKYDHLLLLRLRSSGSGTGSTQSRKDN